MQEKWLFRLGIIFLVIGIIILLISILNKRYLPGILVLIVVGIVLISRSKEK